MAMNIFSGVTHQLMRVFGTHPAGHAQVCVAVNNTELIQDVNIFTLADTVSQVGLQAPVAVSPQSNQRSIQAALDSGSATVVIEVSIDGAKWQQAVQLTPSAGSPDGWAGGLPWPYVRANITAISAGAVTVKMGC